MKTKISKQQARGLFPQMIAIPYCGAQFLLRHKEPFAYSAGVYGWSCDYYDVGGVGISTGYRPIGKTVPYELVHRFEDQARHLAVDSDLDYETERGMIDDLLSGFLREIMKEG